MSGPQRIDASDVLPTGVPGGNAQSAYSEIEYVDVWLTENVTAGMAAALYSTGIAAFPSGFPPGGSGLGCRIADSDEAGAAYLTIGVFTEDYTLPNGASWMKARVAVRGIVTANVVSGSSITAGLALGLSATAGSLDDLTALSAPSALRGPVAVALAAQSGTSCSVLLFKHPALQ